MVLIFIAENHLMRELEGVGPKNLDFFSPEMATSEIHVHKITSIPVFLFGAWT
jgi:hypothetical protein